MSDSIVSTGLVVGKRRPADQVAFEETVLNYFVTAADLLGVPKSLAAIYGICFASAEPLGFMELDARLNISSGSISQPVKIIDLAKQMIELSGFRVGEDIEIKFTGLKPGEKLFEELQHHTEAYAATEHPRIMRFTSNAMFSESGVKELEKNLYQYDSNQLKSILKQLVPEYQPFLD